MTIYDNLQQSCLGEAAIEHSLRNKVNERQSMLPITLKCHVSNLFLKSLRFRVALRKLTVCGFLTVGKTSFCALELKFESVSTQ